MARAWPPAPARARASGAWPRRRRRPPAGRDRRGGHVAGTPDAARPLGPCGFASLQGSGRSPLLSAADQPTRPRSSARAPPCALPRALSCSRAAASSSPRARRVPRRPRGLFRPRPARACPLHEYGVLDEERARVLRAHHVVIRVHEILDRQVVIERQLDLDARAGSPRTSHPTCPVCPISQRPSRRPGRAAAG